jgi:uncharacterized protein YjbJ (UPF0337 family)
MRPLQTLTSLKVESLVVGARPFAWKDFSGEWHFLQSRAASETQFHDYAIEIYWYASCVRSRRAAEWSAASILKERTMNWDRIEGNWKQLKGKAKEQWGKLTDDDLDKISGKREQLAGKIQECYGISKDDAERQLKDWERQLDRH